MPHVFVADQHTTLDRTHRITLAAVAAFAAVLLAGCGPVVAEDSPHTSTAAPSAPGDAREEEDEDFGSVFVYTVNRDTTLQPAAPSDAQRAWDLFVTIAGTADVAERVVEYRTGNAPDSDTMAFVSPATDADNKTWSFAVNLAFATDPTQLRSTLVHEYAHLISLGANEVDFDYTTCATIAMNEGCAREGSAIWAFIQSFWEGYGPDAPGIDNDSPERVEAFYVKNEEDFVSQYAATNASEDFAETFMTFVLEDKPDSDSAIAQKIDFFWDRAGEPERRERIRTALGMN